MEIFELTRLRGQVDDASIGAHDGQEGLTDSQSSPIIDGKGFSALRSGQILLVIVDSGIIDQDITSLVVLADVGAQSGYAGWVSQREFRRVYLHCRSDVSQVDCSPSTRDGVEDQRARALLCQDGADRPSNAAILVIDVWLD